jgi:uncharacterized protein YndB with AHSA1/START domain
MPDDLVTTRSTALSPDQVWQAWTEPGRLATWWWPHLPDATYEVDPQVGGEYRFVSSEAGLGVRGTFTEMVPPERIFMTWEWVGEGAGPIEIVTVGIEEHGDGSQVTVTHSVDSVAGDREGAREGWESVLDRLAALPTDTAGS